MSTALFNKELPFSIKERLKEIGFNTPILCADEYNNSITLYSQLITYACAFDFLFRKGYLISVSKDYDLVKECFSGAFEWNLDGPNTEDNNTVGGFADTWFEAANSAILKAIELIQEKEDRK